jgi:hypothetical protein
MKKITFTIALITIAAIASFAAGATEEGKMPWTQGQGQYQSDAVLSEVTTTVTGTIKLVEDGHIELIVGNDTYELVYPYRLSYAVDLQNGMEITVQGFEAENLRFDNDASTKNLVLKSATIDGETYDFADLLSNNGKLNNRQGGNRNGKNMDNRGGMSMRGPSGRGRR